MSEHTKGPWKVETSWGTIGTIVSADDDVVAQAQQVKGMAVDQTQEERKANAHLIAAAPTMLAALEALRDLLASGVVLTTVGPTSEQAMGRIDQTMMQVEAALRATKGES